MAVSYFLIILAIPFINWPEANSIARYFSSWTRFQVSSLEAMALPATYSSEQIYRGVEPYAHFPSEDAGAL